MSLEAQSKIVEPKRFEILRDSAKRIVLELDWLATRTPDPFNYRAMYGEMQIALHLASQGGISPVEAEEINAAFVRCYNQYHKDF